MQHMDVEMKNQLHLVAHLKHVAISFNNEYNRITT